MAYEIYENGKKISLSDEQMVRIETILSDTVHATLTTKNITEIKGFSFFIKDYQRGYRWTETEVEDLLDDIESIDDAENGYCMQPLVVKKVGAIAPKSCLTLTGLCEEVSDVPQNNVYELLDGQQRLSTLWLIQSFLYKIIGRDTSFMYSIFYELTRKTDGYYIDEANGTIRKWFSRNKYNYNITPTGRKSKKASAEEWKINELDCFINKLEKLFFIWYEVDDTNISSEKVFKSINEGSKAKLKNILINHSSR